MKVLNIINAKKPFILAQIQALEERGVDCTTICVPGEYYADGNNIQSRSAWDYLRFYPTVLSNICESYDVIHAHYGLTAPLALAQPRRPVVLSLWGRDLFGPYGPVSKVTARFCDAVIVRSEEMRQELGMDAYIVERGVDIAQFAPIPQKEAQAEVNWNPDDLHVLFPYSPQREKKNYPLAKKVVAELNSEMEQEVHLHAVYNQSHEKIPYYMNASDIMLMTSLPKSEGSPNTVKEAMACNLPVVSTDVGDVSSLLSSVNNSYVCRDYDELVRKSIDALTGKRSNGRKKIKHLSWENTTEQLMDIYEGVSRDE